MFFSKYPSTFESRALEALCYLRVSIFIDEPMHVSNNTKWCFSRREEKRELKRNGKNEMSKLRKFARKRVECSWLNQIKGRKERMTEEKRSGGRISKARIEVGSYGKRVGGGTKRRRARDQTRLRKSFVVAWDKNFFSYRVALFFHLPFERLPLLYLSLSLLPLTPRRLLLRPLSSNEISDDIRYDHQKKKYERAASLAGTRCRRNGSNFSLRILFFQLFELVDTILESRYQNDIGNRLVQLINYYESSKIIFEIEKILYVN